MAEITFKCPCCNHTVTEEHNDRADKTNFHRDFPEDFSDHLVMVCHSCYDAIKEDMSDHDDTIH